MDLMKIAKDIQPLIKHNSSTILTGLGVVGSLGSAVLAVKATPRAVRKMETAYIQKNNARAFEAEIADGETVEEVPLSRVEVIKVVWKDYIPAVTMEVITIGCIIGAQSINMRRQAALISAFGITEAAFREYQERVAAESPATDRKVRDETARDLIKDNPVSKAEVLLIGNGEQLFYDAKSDRYFMSTVQKVQKTVNDLNFRILNQDYVSLNEFYSVIGLKDLPDGDDMGWTPEHPLEVDYSTHLSDDECFFDEGGLGGLQRGDGNGLGHFKILFRV